MTDRDALIILNLLPGIGPIKVKELLSQFGSPAALLKLSAADLSPIPGIGKKLAETLISWKEHVKVEEELNMVERAGVKIVTMLDDDYPLLLKEIYDPPLLLYVHGTLPKNNSRMLGIVGSRHFTRYGKKMAEELASSASFAKWTVISGLAYGIDAISHRATLNANGKTIAVLGGGLARVHPQDHVPLAREIVEKGGAVISEFPMTYTPNKRSFPMRNRIISGMSQGLIVVEAGLNSGSLITAKFALEQDRLVFAVPGQADNPQALGTNNLIREGAVITESFDDVVNEFEFTPGFEESENLETDTPAINRQEKQEATTVLNDKEKLVMNILQEKRESSTDQLASETGINAGELLATLMQLEMKHLIIQLPGKRFTVK